MEKATGFWEFRMGALDVFSTKPKKFCCPISLTTLQPAGKHFKLQKKESGQGKQNVNFFF
jgi:hypothetical protein